MRKSAGLLLCAVCLAALGCGSNEPAKQAEAVKNEKAPDVFNVNFDTSKGTVIVEIHRDWAPNGVDHFYTLVKSGFYDGTRFFRVLRDFVAQFGINGDPKTNALWATATIPDDPVKQSNVRGTLTYAASGMPNSRSTQLFFNLRTNAMLDNTGFAPIGKVTQGMDVVDSFYNSYGEMAPAGGQGPDPGQIGTQGNEYLQSHFPRLDFVKKATIQ
jgi:peptidyl-prolyl cis-trans isomerase A (cyclophilin A)